VDCFQVVDTPRGGANVHDQQRQAVDGSIVRSLNGGRWHSPVLLLAFRLAGRWPMGATEATFNEDAVVRFTAVLQC